MDKEKDNNQSGSYQNTANYSEKENLNTNSGLSNSKVKNVQSETSEEGFLSILPSQSFGMTNEILNNNIYFINKSK